MSTILVSAIIVTKGRKDYILPLLGSLKRQTGHDLEIIIIDNSLNPDFSKEIILRHPHIKLYSSPSNLLSYCQALNTGINMSAGDFILCLNDDVLLSNDFIEKAMRGFKVNKRIGMVSGKILRFDKKTIDSSGLFLTIWRTARERGYGQLDHGQFEKEGFIFGVNGAVAFYRREMLEEIKIGGEYFDSDFRFFYEDLDIAWRAQNSGWRGYFIPEAEVCHLRGGTARNGKGINKKYARRYLNDELQFDLIKNRYLAIIKNDSLLNLLFFLPCIVFYDIFVWGYIVFFRPTFIKEIFFKSIPLNSALKKRRILLEKAKNS